MSPSSPPPLSVNQLLPYFPSVTAKLKSFLKTQNATSNYSSCCSDKKRRYWNRLCELPMQCHFGRDTNSKSAYNILYYYYYSSCYSVTLRVPTLDFETGWTGELWSKTNLPNWQNLENSIFVVKKSDFWRFIKKKLYLWIFKNFLTFSIFFGFLGFLLGFSQIFWIFLDFWAFWYFGFFGIFGIFIVFFWLLLKVIEVTTEHQNCPKVIKAKQSNSNFLEFLVTVFF